MRLKELFRKKNSKQTNSSLQRDMSTNMSFYCDDGIVIPKPKVKYLLRENMVNINHYIPDVTQCSTKELETELKKRKKAVKYYTGTLICLYSNHSCFTPYKRYAVRKGVLQTNGLSFDTEIKFHDLDEINAYFNNIGHVRFVEEVE